MSGKGFSRKRKKDVVPVSEATFDISKGSHQESAHTVSQGVGIRTSTPRCSEAKLCPASFAAGYAEQCRVRNAQDALGKQLRTPPVPMSHPDFRSFVDFHRVIFLRLKQHEEIIR